MAWSKADHAAYQAEWDADIAGPAPRLSDPFGRNPTCRVRMEGPCDYSVPGSKMCRYCLFTKADLRSVLSLAAILIRREQTGHE